MRTAFNKRKKEERSNLFNLGRNEDSHLTKKSMMTSVIWEGTKCKNGYMEEKKHYEQVMKENVFVITTDGH